MGDRPTDLEALRAGRHPTPEAIADVLQTLILRGQLTGGQALRQDVVARWFEVSKIPVREALRQLTSEGLVTYVPRRGAMVATLRPEEARDILEIRSALEVKALALAMPNWTEARLDDLERGLSRSEGPISIDAWSDLNWSFHEGLYGPSGRTRLVGMIKALNGRVDGYIRLLVSRSDYRLQAQREHRAILASARVRNLGALTALIEQHAMETAEQLLRFMRASQAVAEAPEPLARREARRPISASCSIRRAPPANS